MTTIDEVQTRLNSYTTHKQRKQRLAELKRKSTLNDGFVHMLDAVEGAVLMARVKGVTMTAREVAEEMRIQVMSGDIQHRVQLYKRLTSNDE